jgi:hypothetical protein
MTPAGIFAAAIVCAITLAGSSMLSLGARAETVDLLLVLAADVSRSVDEEELNMQRKGYAAAMSDPRLLRAIADGRHHAITSIGASGAAEQNTVDWTVVCDAEAAALSRSQSDEAVSLRTIADCQTLDPLSTAAALAVLGIDKADADLFGAALCQYQLSTRVSVLSYDINRVFETIDARKGRIDDYRYPLPVIVVDGRNAGSLPTHAPAEIPVFIVLQIPTQPASVPELICLKARTEALGDPPRYDPLQWQSGRYVAIPSHRACPAR